MAKSLLSNDFGVQPFLTPDEARIASGMVGLTFYE
jgi:hypothetical protein